MTPFRCLSFSRAWLPALALACAALAATGTARLHNRHALPITLAPEDALEQMKEILPHGSHLLEQGPAPQPEGGQPPDAAKPPRGHSAQHAPGLAAPPPPAAPFALPGLAAPAAFVPPPQVSVSAHDLLALTTVATIELLWPELVASQQRLRALEAQLAAAGPGGPPVPPGPISLQEP